MRNLLKLKQLIFLNKSSYFLISFGFSAITANVLALGEGGDFSTNVDAESQNLINHKCVCGALSRHFCQTRVSGSLFFHFFLCQYIHYTIMKIDLNLRICQLQNNAALITRL